MSADILDTAQKYVDKLLTIEGRIPQFELVLLISNLAQEITNLRDKEKA